MARNRVIYQSESLFVSKDIQSTQTSDHYELRRIQSANYGFTINRQDVNQFGNLARIDSLVLESPTVNFDMSYYLGDGYNENSLGFDILGESQFASGHLDASSGKNIFILTSAEGLDSVGISGGDNYSLIGIGNSFLSDYTVDLAVGSIPTVSVSFEASNINSINGQASTVVTGSLPSINPEEGDPIIGTASINFPVDAGQEGPTALRPGDVSIEFPGFDGGQDESGTMTTISGGGSFHVQSASLSVPLSRSPIQKLGSKFPFARVVDLPANASLNVSAILNTVEAGNLAKNIAGCGGDSDKEISISVKSCDQTEAIRWTLKGATLDSESWSSSIGSNKSVDLTFGVQLGGIDDPSKGIFCVGSTEKPLGLLLNLVNVGDVSNDDDTTNYGAVDYNYRISKYAISRGNIKEYNEANPSIKIGSPVVIALQSYMDEEKKPMGYISWNHAARFVNWLNVIEGKQPAYRFLTDGGNDNITLWDSADAWQLGGENLFRHKDTKYFLPSVDEWYKAAYYDTNKNGGGAGYWTYPTAEDTPPTPVQSGTTAGTAVYDGQSGPADVDQAGGLSYYGTMGQGGNIVEWTETDQDGTNDNASSIRDIIGGGYNNLSAVLANTALNSNLLNPQSPNRFDLAIVGFRIASTL